jgi:hypothetical protein
MEQARKELPNGDQPSLIGIWERIMDRTRKGIDATLEKHKVDAIVAPTAGPAWLTDWINGDQASKAAAVLTACKSRSRLAINEFSPEISGFNWQLEILNELRPFARFEIKLNTEVDNDYEFSIFDLQLAIVPIRIGK